MKYFITGCAGYIGSTLVDYLLLDPSNQVVGWDNFSTGRKEFLQDALKSINFELVEGDCFASPDHMPEHLLGCDMVIHLAANADVRHGFEHPRTDLEQNTIGTFNVLEAMRRCNVKRIAFASTGSVYGASPIYPTPEYAPFPIQTSLYGASKLAGEALIQAYCSGYDMTGYIFRFVSVLGERYQHGFAYDFVRQLLEHPDGLTVQGNGKQIKSYQYIGDCLRGMMLGIFGGKEKVNIFNLGTDETCDVKSLVKAVCDTMGVSPKISYGKQVSGWRGDEHIFLNCNRIKLLGWRALTSIQDAVKITVQYLLNNQWLFKNE